MQILNLANTPLLLIFQLATTLLVEGLTLTLWILGQILFVSISSYSSLQRLPIPDSLFQLMHVT